MIENKTVSVIVPIYNTEQYLDDCIAALVNQTYKNLEILLIVDGATDGSAEICRKWQKRDSRIIVYENENHGVSYSRNYGIDKATGGYVTFVDSDDMIHEEYVQSMILAKETTGADFVAMKAVAFRDAEMPSYTQNEQLTECHGDLHECLFTLSNGFVWGKLFEINKLRAHGICFEPQIYVCEDLLFNFRYVDHCKKMVFINRALYGYRQRTDSAVHNTASPRWFSCLQVYQMLFDGYQETSAFPHIVFHGLKNLYEAQYLLRHGKIEPEKIPTDIEQQIRCFEKQKRVLRKKDHLKLIVCKYLFFVVMLRRK